MPVLIGSEPLPYPSGIFRSGVILGYKTRCRGGYAGEILKNPCLNIVCSSVFILYQFFPRVFKIYSGFGSGVRIPG